MKGFSQLSAPLTDLTKKDSLHRDMKEKYTFEKLKEIMSSCPILALPNFNMPFILECDLSGEGIGVVLMQNHHLVAFKSQKIIEEE